MTNSEFYMSKWDDDNYADKKDAGGFVVAEMPLGWNHSSFPTSSEQYMSKWDDDSHADKKDAN